MVIQPLALDGLHHWLPWNWHDGQKNATNMVGEMEPIPGTKGMGFNLQSPFYRLLPFCGQQRPTLSTGSGSSIL